MWGKLWPQRNDSPRNTQATTEWIATREKTGESWVVVGDKLSRDSRRRCLGNHVLLVGLVGKR